MPTVKAEKNIQVVNIIINFQDTNYHKYSTDNYLSFFD